MHLDSINQYSCILLAYMVMYKCIQGFTKLYKALSFFADFCFNVVSSFTALGPCLVLGSPLLSQAPPLSPTPLSLSLWPHLQTFYLTAHLFLTYAKFMGYFTIYVPFLASYSSRPTTLLSRAKLFQRTALQELKSCAVQNLHKCSKWGTEIIWNKEFSFKSVRSKQQ